jgi:hypothetical protein
VTARELLIDSASEAGPLRRDSRTTKSSRSHDVAASFLVAMLSGQPVAAMDGRVERLDWKARDGDWQRS